MSSVLAAKKREAFITSCSSVVPLRSTKKADSGQAWTK
jgi:hypothetical protein